MILKKNVCHCLIKICHFARADAKEVCLVRARTNFGESPALASRVRSAFAKRTEFFEAKHVGTFNASAARQPGEFLLQ